ncbi:GTP-binding protein EngB required for normal cell division [Arthrobacter stackebrandtii]|uniref:GTP-binding protein EngB required for normal cell division n=1 Tax=Arthrobacter stackebrandtii TaxID=272161 RepID=A0ABS4Z179_9MICC|nr:GTPase [Arthrobacter stackebrandtii]MBP2414013.1 GTP-binding protein EngB required for normal cell division [Arthrobacter stackebrandtii]PYG99021.1 ABC transporter [Arthrobacter stackebrandtii]
MSRHRQDRAESTLARQLVALNEARELGEGRLDDASLQDVYDVLERATERRSLSADHTVVGFFGATGSGKSSLFNAVAGTFAATVAVRRPTTSEPLAMVWGMEGSAPLLDWLEVADRREGAPVPGLMDDAGGLVLLDLPDFDSVELGNRAIVERLAGQVDVLVWVMDPQKYADAAIHNDFIRAFSSHADVTLVVLNQIDRLDPSEVKPVLESLSAILDRDGLRNVKISGVSATTGEGIPELRQRIAAVVKAKAAKSARLAADVAVAAQRLADASGDGVAAGVHQQDRKALAAGLAGAVHVETVVSAVKTSYQLEATRRTGWPVTRWVSRFRKDPLRRLSLRREGTSEVNRTSLPPAGASEQAQIDSSVREFADAASAGASGPWRASIRAAARSNRDQLPDALDQAVAGTDLKANTRAWWWPVFSVIQWLALLVAVGGLVWLGVLAVLGYLQLPVPETPKVEGWPLPTLMLLGGAVLGIFLAVTSKFIALAGANGRAAQARRRLRESVAETSEALVVDPTEAEVAASRAFAEALKNAR